MVLLLWHFFHLNPILCSILLKDCSCPRRMYFLSYYWKEFFTTWNNFVVNVEVSDCSLTTHKSESSMITFFQVFEASSSLGCSEGFLYFPHCTPLWCFWLISLIHFVRTTCWYNLTFLHCYFFTYAIHMISYFPSFTVNSFTLLFTGHRLLAVSFATSLKSNLCTALTTQNTK
jgi:hypothetical protein